MKSTLLARMLSLALFSASSLGIEPPATREAVQAIVERSKKEPNALLELKGAPLDIIMPDLRELWIIGDLKTKQWMDWRQAGKEKQFFQMEANSGRDHDYLAKAYPLARDILMNHPDFEWTIQTKLGRMTYILNAEQSTSPSDRSDEYTQAYSNYSQELGFASLVPGDGALRIIGSCLTSPYFPKRDDGDVMDSSPAARAQSRLALLLKDRYGEDLPKDIEAARAWWKANENRFAAKETAAPKSPNPSKNVPEKGSPTDLPNKPVSSQATDSQSPSAVTQREIHWPISIAIVFALLAVVAWFLRKKR